jgi:hypothetical protein
MSSYTFSLLNLNAHDKQIYTEKCHKSQKYNQATQSVVADRNLVASHFRELSYHKSEANIPGLLYIRNSC